MLWRAAKKRRIIGDRGCAQGVDVKRCDGMGSAERSFSNLFELNEERLRLFGRYERKEITKEEYLRRLRPLDEAVERLEMAVLTRTVLSEK